MEEDWTVERLDALPECTTVSYMTEGTGWTIVKGKGDAWFYVLLGRMRTSEHILTSAVPGSIRVVSVPVDALLSDETVRAASGGHALGPTNSLVRIVLGDAVAHVTGESLR